MSKKAMIELVVAINETPAGTVVHGEYEYTSYRGSDVYRFNGADGEEEHVWVWPTREEAEQDTLSGICIAEDSAVEHPRHYNDVEGMPEVWDILDAFFPDNPLVWNAGKYLLRAGRKDSNSEIQELEKMVQYAQRRIDKLKETENE